MELTFQKHGTWTVGTIVGRIDAAGSPQLESEIGAKLDKKVTCLALDLALVDYISSAGLRVLLGTLKRLGKEGGKMALVHPHEYVMEVLQVSGFAKIFTIADDLDKIESL